MKNQGREERERRKKGESNRALRDKATGKRGKGKENGTMKEDKGKEKDERKLGKGEMGK